MCQFFYIFIILFFLPFYTFAESQISFPACLIAHQIKKSLDHTEEKYMNALIKGIEAHNNHVKLTPEETAASHQFFKKQREIQAQHHLIASQEWLLKKSQDDSIQKIIPSKLLYRTIKEGIGKTLTDQNANVKINYVIHKFKCLFPETSEEKKVCDLSQTIPGFSHGMISMKEGEIRKIYIHPDYAYGHSNTFEPNIALEATVELLNILPAQNKIPPLNETAAIEKPKITQHEIEQLLLTKYYTIGWKLWNHLKFGHQLFNKEDLIHYLKIDVSPHLSDLEFNKEINHIHWLIYHQRIHDD